MVCEDFQCPVLNCDDNEIEGLLLLNSPNTPDWTCFCHFRMLTVIHSRVTVVWSWVWLILGDDNFKLHCSVQIYPDTN
jgi:hypothetical protein